MHDMEIASVPFQAPDSSSTRPPAYIHQNAYACKSARHGITQSTAEDVNAEHETSKHMCLECKSIRQRFLFKRYGTEPGAPLVPYYGTRLVPYPQEGMEQASVPYYGTRLVQTVSPGTR